MPDATRRIVLLNKMPTTRTVTLAGSAALGTGTRWQMTATLGSRNTGSATDIAPSNLPIELVGEQNTLELPGYSLTILSLPPLPFDRWRLEQFSALNAASDSDADPDGDGRTNLLEYALATNPQQADATDATAGEQSGRLRLQFRRMRAELIYHVESSNDLNSWSIVASNPGIVGKNVVVEDSVPITSDTPRFLRLRVEVP